MGEIITRLKEIRDTVRQEISDLVQRILEIDFEDDDSVVEIVLYEEGMFAMVLRCKHCRKPFSLGNYPLNQPDTWWEIFKPYAATAFEKFVSHECIPKTAIAHRS